MVTETIVDDGSTLETLTIPGRTEYNGTRVQCAVLKLGGSVQSWNSTLSVQGIYVLNIVLRM